MRELDIDKVRAIFVPSSPVKDERYFVGRLQEVADLNNIIDSPGQFGIVTGRRGVGKTTLVKQVVTSLRRKRNVIWITCFPESKFQTIFLEVLSELHVQTGAIEEVDHITKSGNIGGDFHVVRGEGSISKETTRKRTIDDGELNPRKVFNSLCQNGNSNLIVIDEYDTISGKPRSTTNHDLASLMKQLSDNSERHDTKIVVVGIANTAQDLIGAHPSIQRCAIELFLHHLSPRALRSFIEKAEADLSIKFEDVVRQNLINGSTGLPYFVHLIGLRSIEAMIRRDKQSRVVTLADFGNGLDDAIEKSMRAEMAHYLTALDQFAPNEFAVVEVIATLNENYPMKDTIRKECHSRYKLSDDAVDAALLSLYQDKHFLYLNDRTDRVGFSDPLLKPFLRTKWGMGKSRKDNDANNSNQLKLFD